MGGRNQIGCARDPDHANFREEPLMSVWLPTAWKRLALLLAVAALGLGSGQAQEKSVYPGINTPYQNPDIPALLQHLEGEGREAFLKRKEIVAACGLAPGMAVADVGAGTGLFTRLLAAGVGPKGKVYAVDISRKFIDHIQKTCRKAGLANVTGVVCTPASAELPPDCVDLVFLCDVYHHFEYPRKTMASLYRALRPGGRLVLVDYRRVEGKSPGWILKHLRAGQEVFTKEIEAAGFEVLDRPDFLKENYLVRFRKVEPSHKACRPPSKKDNGASGPSPRISSMPGPVPRLREYCLCCESFQCSWTPRLASGVPSPSGS
jgi:SAM-dependent methyltransferase